MSNDVHAQLVPNSEISIISLSPNHSKSTNLNPDYYACFKNELIFGCQDMTLREAKLLRIVISQILSDENEMKPYKIKLTELAKILNLQPSSLRRDAEKMCDNLHKRVITIKNDDDTWEKYNWLSHSRYDGTYIHIKLSDDLKPFLLQLKNNFTKIQLRETIPFSSYYGLRIYEMIKSEWNRRLKTIKSVMFYIDDLRKLFDLNGRLKTFSHFKNCVIIPAVESINNNEQALFTVDADYITEHGKTVKAVNFFIYPRQTGSLEDIL